MIFSNYFILWVVIGIILCLVELMLPGLIIAFFGAGAIITGIICALFDISLKIQLFIFLVSSLALIFILRKYFKKIFLGNKTNQESLEDDFIGQKAIAITDITQEHNGKIMFRGTNWTVSSEKIITKDSQVQIVGQNNLTLKVKSIK